MIVYESCILLVFNTVTFYDEQNLSLNLDYVILFDNVFLEGDIAKGMIVRGKRSGKSHNFTMDVDPDYKYFEKFRGGVQWYK